jgi:hypothetical protein
MFAPQRIAQQTQHDCILPIKEFVFPPMQP